MTNFAASSAEFFIGHLFALVIFYSDKFLRVKRGILRWTPKSGKVRRFLGICAKLPLDLQMTLCNRAFRSPRSIVSSKDSEPGFKWLARDVTWNH